VELSGETPKQLSAGAMLAIAPMGLNPNFCGNGSPNVAFAASGTRFGKFTWSWRCRSFSSVIVSSVALAPAGAVAELLSR
jgi:hypothetical protein